MNFIVDQVKGIKNILWICDIKVYRIRFYRVGFKYYSFNSKNLKEVKVKFNIKQINVINDLQVYIC